MDDLKLKPYWCMGDISEQMAEKYSEFSRETFWVGYLYQAVVGLYRSNVVNNGGDVLEIGSGPGWLTIRMHEVCPRARYVVSDSSEQMLRIARANARALGIGDIAAVTTTAESLRFADESFDLVTSQSVFRQLKDKKLAVREAVRVLRSGGVAYFSDILGGVDGSVKREIAGSAPGLNGAGFVLAALESGLTREGIEAVVRESGIRKWEVLVGGVGGFALASREVLEWVRRGFPLRALRDESARSGWSRRVSDYWVHIYLYK